MHLFKQIEEKHDTRPVETSRLLGIAYTKYNAMKSGHTENPEVLQPVGQSLHGAQWS